MDSLRDMGAGGWRRNGRLAKICTRMGPKRPETNPCERFPL
jgi:hypothetical protein